MSRGACSIAGSGSVDGVGSPVSAPGTRRETGSSVGIGAATSSTGVTGGVFLSALARTASLFFSSVLKNTLMVVRNDLCGLQSSAATGVCSQTGQDEGSED